MYIAFSLACKSSVIVLREGSSERELSATKQNAQDRVVDCMLFYRSLSSIFGKRRFLNKFQEEFNRHAVAP